MQVKQDKIPKGWKETKLVEVAKILSGSTPSTKEPDFWDGDIPWITPKDLSNYNSVFVSRGERNITDIGLKNSSTQLLPKNTILFSSRAPIGYIAIASNELTTNQGFKNIVCDEKGSHYKFFYYWLKFSSNSIEKLCSGSTFSEANANVMRSLQIKLPSLSEQKAIAAILSSLDDKIELLREQNKTLESIARTIFKEWFVNFKVDGKKLKVNTKTGLPEGWRMGKYNELADVITGKGLKKEFIKKKGKYLVLGANGRLGETDEFLFDEDLILTGRVGTLGTVYISKGKVWISDNVLITKAKNIHNFYFAYFNLKRLNFESLNRGSTQPLITQTDLKNVEIIIPKDEILESWHNIVSNLFLRIFNNNSQIQTLSRLRDSLLPKLMKGEIRVKT